MEGPKPLILVSNDDGVHSKGLRALLEMLGPEADVVAVAPATPQSAKSSALTVGEPLRIHHHPDIAGASVYSVTGTPVDCVKLALHAIVGRRPDIMLSGINHGANSGNSVTYSGTMGAAIEACMVGIPAIGFSLLDFGNDADFNGCTPVVRMLVPEILKVGLPEGVCLNVNIPAVKAPNGIKVVRAARGYWTEEYSEMKDPFGNSVWWLTGVYNNSEPDADDTDEYWLKRGYATIVPTVTDQSACAHIDSIARSLNL